MYETEQRNLLQEKIYLNQQQKECEDETQK